MWLSSAKCMHACMCKSTHSLVSLLLQAQMAQHHHTRHGQGCGVGQVLARKVGRSAMHGLS